MYNAGPLLSELSEATDHSASEKSVLHELRNSHFESKRTLLYTIADHQHQIRSEIIPELVSVFRFRGLQASTTIFQRGVRYPLGLQRNLSIPENSVYQTPYPIEGISHFGNSSHTQHELIQMEFRIA